MALGFGFNKAKVLSSAEKHVQQGKIHNAIAEYEKVAKHDPKDLTILNTLGDLYARLGEAEKAAAYFKRVGEAYAADGFTVKAIAIYKKITKIAPGEISSIQRLAELYTQQNLLTDARQQYLQVADQLMKSGDLEGAVRVFQKMLQLDPDNAAMQTRLAELYLRMGKKDEAQEVFFRSAESLRRRGASDAADEALGRVLNIAPGHPGAVTLRAQIAVESGNAAIAVRHLENLPNLDSHAEALALLLQAQLLLGQEQEAEPVARKLLTVHNDIRGVNSLAEWLLSRGQFEPALRLYSEYCDRLLASDPAPLLQALRTTTERVKDNAGALEIILRLLQKAGEQSQITEVLELLAHALVKKGELARARDLYRDLSVLEPENPVHDQNYRQMVARLGEDSALRSLSPQQGAQAFMVDELEASAPELPQQHAQPVADAVNAAVTESELLESYNVIPKAIAGLEMVLPLAPNDLRLNQRLASLYARSGRFQEAAACCETLAGIYRRAGHHQQSAEYAEMAARYRTSAQSADPPNTPNWGALEAAPVTAEASLKAAGSEPLPAPASLNTAPAEFTVAPESPVSASGSDLPEIDIDLSDEWQPAPAEAASTVELPPELAQLASQEDLVEIDEPEVSPTEELLEEIRFYIGQQMWEEAAAAADKCLEIAPNLSELGPLREQIRQGMAASAASPVRESVPSFSLDPVPPIVDPLPPAAPSTPTLMPAASLHFPSKPVMPLEPAASTSPLESLVAGLENSLDGDFMPASDGEATPVQPAATASSAPVPGAASTPRPIQVLEPAPVAYEPITATQTAVADEPPTAEQSEDAAASTPGDMLSEMFAEFKQGAEQDQDENNDPENHYNLGIAFREMALLDESIGELQKVAQRIESGTPFRDTLQVYTLLGQCFVEKGVPEAAVRWYEKALSYASDSQARVAVHYDLAAAHEAAGDRQNALRHFLEVYGTNIDYRDVAERIKALRT